MADATLHRIAEARSLAYHRAIAERLRREPVLLESVAARLRQEAGSGDPHRRYWAKAWLQVVECPVEECIAFLTDPGERVAELHQSTLFAGLFSPTERWPLHRAVREQWQREGRLPRPASSSST